MVGDLTSAQPTKGRLAFRGVVVLGVLLVLMILAGSAALLMFAGAAVDHLQSRQERVLATYALSRFKDRVVGEVTTATVWDQAYFILRPGGDLDWADSEIGSYYANNLGHDRVLVIDEHDRPFYAWEGEARTDAANLTALQRDAQPLIDKVRAAERAGVAPPPGLGLSDPGLALTADGFIRSEGVYYVVAVSNVVRDLPGAPQASGPHVLVISARTLSATLAQFGKEMHGREVSISAKPRPDHNYAPIVDPTGRTIGVLEWQSLRPGMAVLRKAAPLVALGLFVLLVIGGALTRYMRSIARQLDAEEHGHREAMRQLVTARDHAEEANLAKSQFLANMSHEIRTPLNGILGMVQVMERSGLGPPHAERLEIIREAGETLLSVLNGILDLSKIEAGRFQLDIQEFDLATMVGAACKPFANLAAQKEIDFEIDIASEAMGVWRGDPMRLRQVLSNLTANAVKFTAEGEVRIEVQATPKGLSFTVSDTGIGIAADRVAQLFEKFVQADSSMSRRFGGTGLGLAICREFVNIMGGRLVVQTQEGHGSTFVFDLPLPKVREVSAAIADAAASDTPALPLRILAAEDSKPNQLVLKALLEPLGVELHIVTDGVEAVRAFHDGGFDAVLMDVQMPNMNGIDATKAIRRYEAEHGLRRTPILALSANVMNHQLDEYAAAGMDGYVAKPIDAVSLIESLQQSLDLEELFEEAAV